MSEETLTNLVEVLKIACRILGTPPRRGLGSPVWLDTLCPSGDGWRFGFLGEVGLAFEVLIEPRKELQRSFVQTDSLAFSVVGAPESPLAVPLTEALARRLRRVSYESVDNILRPAFEKATQIQEEPDPGKPVEADPMSPCPGIHKSFDHPLAWKRFFADEECRQSRDEVIAFDPPWIRIEHGDLECQFLSSKGFVCLPWRNVSSYDRTTLGFLNRSRGRVTPDEMGELTQGLFTNLQDIDVITGGASHLERVLGAVRDNTKPSALFINNTCVPEVIGDDIQAAVRKECGGCSFPVIVKGQTADNPYDRDIRSIRRAFGRTGTDLALPSVNLVGFAPGRDLDEIRATLAELGMPVNEIMVPRLSRESAARYLDAQAHFLLANKDWESLYVDLFQGVDLVRIEAPNPYGIAGTTAFFQAVAEVLLADPEARQCIAPRRDEFVAKSFREVNRTVVGHTLGFISPPQILVRFADAALTWGIPVLSMVREMGFQVSFAAVCPHEEEPEARALLSGILSGDDRLDFVATPDELDAWLDDTTAEAVFSEFFFDERLLSKGLTPFSLQLFEKGYSGAVRTADRLVRRCSFPIVRTRRPGGIRP